MDETRIIALRALRELLDDAGPDDWDDLVASYSALNNAITKKKPMTRKNRARIAEHLRRLGWRERAIGEATTICGDAIPPAAKDRVVSTAARRDSGG
jgi:hypothetical protein